MERLQDIGFMLIGVAAVIYALATAYVDINYMLLDKASWEQSE
jgi:hypothetical protein